jgi:hypothetical protein
MIRQGIHHVIPSSQPTGFLTNFKDLESQLQNLIFREDASEKQIAIVTQLLSQL